MHDFFILHSFSIGQTPIIVNIFSLKMLLNLMFIIVPLLQILLIMLKTPILLSLFNAHRQRQWTATERMILLAYAWTYKYGGVIVLINLLW